MAIKRILHVTGMMNRAGTETMLMNLYRKIDKTQWQFDFIFYSQEEADYEKEILSMGGRVFRINHASSIKEHVQIYKTYGPFEAIHAHTLFHCGIAITAARMAGISIRISHAHTTSDSERSFIKKTYIRTMRKAIVSQSTHLMACSKGAADYLFGSKTPFLFLPNTIPFHEFLPNEAVRQEVRKEFGLESFFVIGHAGRFIPAKNQRFLIELMREIHKVKPDARLLLIGDGDTRKEMEEFARSEGVEALILFAGLRMDMERVFQAMDVFVLPSLYEGLGLVLLEAQAAGLTCVVSEAIQPEADLGMKKVHPVALHAPKIKWVHKIIQSNRMTEANAASINQSFQKRHYTEEHAMQMLLDVYQEGKEDSHEKAINRYV
ncbi:glycosyltransferase family 1 protein [Jeotgalibacillus aurantiacus]|uniref:glycosyltransferase family 1 protein n=1 Tax=Jeotgalibacillus aurantiacus TaxID=2763266 RepID=UPI001D0AA5BF|nr:glycosyltransferase family 1 protein [Jeotgalibacillus aurantiacus]